MNYQKELIIAVDFDGTIVDHKYPKIGDNNEGAIECLQMLQEKYCAKLILYTMRSGNELTDAVRYCKDKGIVFWGINDNPTQNMWTSSPKVYAHFYIDDASIMVPSILGASGRNMVDWKKIKRFFINNLKIPLTS